ncbi:O-antigen ligase domain-containing protein [Mycolicibacterium sp. 018/SC-01/001]|uniref:O-antigen ligase domain-containing protein n=1 Tax=Mycolicibacterium sp. 018/SC-01/001 TaxID=2592069 RepID=UPI00117BF752|nr:O-antigen ligase domain-containing protein [Mycolicibacterium sp. 018/SC-01/001]TRW80488.1 O-antigen ligase domain-containing protein [Mycolicibacterium sp. 018/SC-01/001]
MTIPPRLRGYAMTFGCLAATAAVLVPVTVLANTGEHRLDRLGIGIIAVVVAAAVVVLHPRWVYMALAFALGSAPAATIPGLGTPVVLVLAFAMWCALLVHPLAETRTSAMELAIAGLVVTSLCSLVMTVSSVRDVTEFIKWLLATSVVFALTRFDLADLRAFGKVFVWGTFAGATLALIMRFLDPGRVLFTRLQVIGVFDISDTGGFTRLTGTYVEPNSAGISFLVGLCLSVALLRGGSRLLTSAVILVALVFTLSRAAMVSVVAAVVFLLLFQPMSSRVRVAILAALGSGVVGFLAVPLIYTRFTGTFKDRGSLDRAASLSEYAYNMAGHWWFGKGWGLAEFISGEAAYRSNHVANSPLLSIYRGGIFVGVAFVVVLLVGVAVSYRNARRTPWEAAVIGAGFTGFTVIGLQLDFPVVTHATVTMVWSVLIAFLIRNPVTDCPPEQREFLAAPGRHRSRHSA